MQGLLASNAMADALKLQPALVDNVSKSDEFPLEPWKAWAWKVCLVLLALDFFFHATVDRHLVDVVCFGFAFGFAFNCSFSTRAQDRQI